MPTILQPVCNVYDEMYIGEMKISHGHVDGCYCRFLTAFATSGVFYHWQRSGKLAYSFTVLLLLGSIIKKYGDLHNWNPLPLKVEIQSQCSVLPIDWTLIKDPRGRKSWE